MEMVNPAIEALLHDRTIAYHSTYAKIMGGTAEGVWLSQMLYWDGKKKEDCERKGVEYDGWFYEVDRDIRDETGLSEREVRASKSRAKSLGIMEIKRDGMPAKTYYKINLEKIVDAISSYKVSKLVRTASYEQVGTDSRSKRPPDVPKMSTDSTVSAKPAETTIKFVPKSLIDTEGTGEPKKKKFPPQTPLARYLQENADFGGSKWDGFKTLKQRVEWEDLEREREVEMKSAIDWAIEKGAFSKGVIAERVMTATKNNKNTPKGVPQPFVGRVIDT